VTARTSLAAIAATLLLAACTTAPAPAPQPPEPRIVPLTLEQQWEIDGRAPEPADAAGRG